MSHEYTIYGADLSYYTGKIRAYMRYKNLDWEEKAATLDIYQSLILPRVGAAIIPILQTRDDHIVQDTTDMIDYLESRHPEGSIYPTTPLQKLVALMLEFYGDEWLVIHAMHYRWNYIDQQKDFVLGGFGRLGNPDGSLEEQVALGEQMSAPFRGVVKKLGVTEKTIPAIEASYHELLDILNLHFSKYPFLLGSKPSIGDYGLLGPLYAHLGRDPYPKAEMQERAPQVFAWIERMNNPTPLSGEFLANDEIPATLIPLLKKMSQEQLPDTLSVIQHNHQWLQDNPGGNLPRQLGSHDFSVGGVTDSRMISSYAQWMFQRAHSMYHDLSDADKLQLEKPLNEYGFLDALNTPIKTLVERKTGQLELVEAVQ